jgi:hypothetical protein
MFCNKREHNISPMRGKRRVKETTGFYRHTWTWEVVEMKTTWTIVYFRVSTFDPCTMMEIC